MNYNFYVQSCFFWKLRSKFFKKISSVQWRNGERWRERGLDNEIQRSLRVRKLVRSSQGFFLTAASIYFASSALAWVCDCYAIFPSKSLLDVKPQNEEGNGMEPAVFAAMAITVRKAAEVTMIWDPGGSLPQSLIFLCSSYILPFILDETHSFCRVQLRAF